MHSFSFRFDYRNGEIPNLQNRYWRDTTCSAWSIKERPRPTYRHKSQKISQNKITEIYKIHQPAYLFWCNFIIHSMVNQALSLLTDLIQSYFRCILVWKQDLFPLYAIVDVTFCVHTLQSNINLGQYFCCSFDFENSLREFRLIVKQIATITILIK